MNSDALLEEEIGVLKQIGYGYFRDKFLLPDLPRKLRSKSLKSAGFWRYRPPNRTHETRCMRQLQKRLEQDG